MLSLQCSCFTFGRFGCLHIKFCKKLNNMDVSLLCHAIIETAFIFYVAGANILAITAGRLVIAFMVTVIAARLPVFRKMEEES